jgi:heparin binding hemagglutinin HbhA
MRSVDNIRKTVTESRPVRAAVGATDLAVERVRETLRDPAATQAKVEATVSRVQKAVGETVAGFDAKAVRTRVGAALDPKTLQETAQHLPGAAAARAADLAGRAEARYGSLAERGKDLVERVRTRPAAQDLLTQGRETLTRTRSAATTVRKVVDEKAEVARTAVGLGRPSTPAGEDAPVVATRPDPAPAAPAAVAGPAAEEPGDTPADTSAAGGAAEKPVAGPAVEKPAGSAAKKPSTAKAPGAATAGADAPASGTRPRKTTARKVTAKTTGTRARKSPAKKSPTAE